MADLLDPKKLAFAIAKAVAGAAVSKGSSLLIEKLTDLIGLVDDTMEEYYNKLRKQLTAIQDAQIDVKEMLQSILRSQTDIKAQIEDATLRAALQRFGANRNVIASNYASLTESFADLPKDTRRAADEIYQVLKLSNANGIDEAMRNIHDEVYGEAESKGLITMQEIICKQALAAWAQKPENLVTSNYVGNYGLLYDWFPTFPNNTKILTNAFNEAIPAVLESTIVPMFRAFLTIQLQGLLILQSSWDKTAQSNRLQGHVANISSQVREMESFYDKLIAKADTMVDEVLTTYGKPLPTYVKDAWADDVHLEGHTRDQVRPNNMIACPYSNEWKCWPVRNGDPAIGGGSTALTIGQATSIWLDTGPSGYQDAYVTIVKTPLRHDGKDRLIQVKGVGPFWGARRAICFVKTDKEKDYLIPKPSTFVKLRISARDWKGYLPDISVPLPVSPSLLLEQLLAAAAQGDANKWSEADQETWKILIKVSHREKEGDWLKDNRSSVDVAAINSISNSVLNRIDQLWKRFSNGKFGFQVQKKIWQDCNAPGGYAGRQSFGVTVGWYKTDRWIRPGEIQYNLAAPMGHLPASGIYSALSCNDWSVALSGLNALYARFQEGKDDEGALSQP
ncbi:MAG: GUN4 domain-containing protein [Terrimicrobiaceae bacterium]